MAGQNSSILKDALDLIQLYNTNLGFKRTFDRAVKIRGTLFRGRPLQFYVLTLIHFSPFYNQYYREFKQDHTKLTELLNRIWLKDKDVYAKVQQGAAGNLSVFHQDFAAELDRLEGLPNNQKETTATVKQYESLSDKIFGKKEQTEKPATGLDKIGAAPPAPKPPFTSPAPQLSLEVPYPVKNTLLDARTFLVINLRKLITRNPLAFASLLTGSVGGVMGYLSTGQAFAGVGGFIAGAAAPSVIQNISSGEQRQPQYISYPSIPGRPGSGIKIPSSIANKLLKKGASSLAKRAVTTTAARGGIMFLVSNPLGWVILGIILLFAIWFILN